MIARFPVTGALNSAGGHTRGTVLIDRAARTFSVRPLRQRRVYTLPLSAVATMVCRAIIDAELREKKAAKKAKKAGRK